MDDLMPDDTGLSPDLLSELRRYDTPTLSNAIESFDIRPRDEGFANMDVRCMFPDLGVMVGYAATATIRARVRGDSNETALWAHVRSLPGPRVVVVQDLDEPPGHGALWGEVQSSIFQALDCAGVITDGCVRDLKEVRELGFPLFARGPGVSHAYVHVSSVGELVTIGGLRVAPGDLMHADQHGVLLVPREIAAELPAAAERVIDRERTFLHWIRSSDFHPDRLAEMRRAGH
jgi:4-hydroxy-4-methyl-2-oxoglutarate aldolase